MAESSAVVVRAASLDYAVLTFVEATGSSTATALKYLTGADGDMPVAINAYHSDHGSDFVEEEI